MSQTLIPQLHEPEARKALAEVLIALFQRWRLGEDDQLALLQLPNASALARYRAGGPLEDDPQLLERVGHLLAIDRALRRKYPHAPELRDRWIKTTDPGLGGRNPLEIVWAQGMDGLQALRDHLGA